MSDQAAFVSVSGIRRRLFLWLLLAGWFSESQSMGEISPEILEWTREHLSMWLEDPNEDEKIVMLYHILDVIGYPSDVSESGSSSLSTELDSDSDSV